MQPQLDVGILNEILNESGKKITDPFRLNHLEKAINALYQHDIYQWCRARSDYLLYKDQYDEALEFLNNFSQQHPMTEELAIAYFNVGCYHNECAEWALNNLECIAKKNKTIEKYEQSIKGLRHLFLIDTLAILQK